MSEKEPTKYQVFDGKRYEVFDLCFSEDEAKEEAEELEKKGFLARVVATSGGTWQIFRRRAFR